MTRCIPPTRRRFGGAEAANDASQWPPTAAKAARVDPGIADCECCCSVSWLATEEIATRHVDRLPVTEGVYTVSRCFDLQSCRTPRTNEPSGRDTNCTNVCAVVAAQLAGYVQAFLSELRCACASRLVSMIRSGQITSVSQKITPPDGRCMSTWCAQ